MLARIYCPTKNAMQSGKAKNRWLLEYAPVKSEIVEDFMGYSSSSNVYRQLRLFFDTKEQAIAFAQSQNIAYELQPRYYASVKKISYEDNFSADRMIPWTH